MLLVVNTLIQFGDEGNGRIERILWISPQNDLMYTIDIYINTCCAKVRIISEILEGIKAGYIKVLQSDPFQRLANDKEISGKDKKLRDKAYSIISPILIEPDIYDDKKRRQLILKASKDNNVSDRVIYKYLQRYFQRGMSKNSLLSDLHLCGGKGKNRQYKSLDGKGVIIDEDIKRIFRLAIDKYYYSNRQNPLTVVYQLMIKEFFVEDYKIHNGIKIPVIKEKNELPTLNQFYYWFQKERNIKKEITTRRSAKKYELEHRAILSNSTREALGPGSIYQVDATIGDIFLCSRYNRNWIIGRPIIYLCLDVFSRCIVGMYIGLEGPSWIGSTMAIANATMDKVEFCKEYGIQIEQDEWPISNVIPETIEADRGEWESKVAEGVVTGLNIKVKNTSSYRGDMKAIVERYFRTINENIKPFVPGFINDDFRERGSRDYRLDGKLSLFEFTQLMIKIVLYYNNCNWLSNYNRDEMMIADDLQCIPVKLWSWGLANRAGRLRTVTDEQVKLHLMKTDYASITSHGIKLKGIYYSCKRGLTEGWFEKARNYGSWKVTVSYDMRNMNYIYIKNDDGKSFEKCYLLEHQERYLNYSLEEIEYLKKMEKLKEKNHEEQVLQNRIDLLSEIESIVGNAEKATDDVASNLDSNRKRVKGIRKARQLEKFLNRESEAFELGKENRKNEAGAVSVGNPSCEDEEGLNDIQLLRKKQRERLNEQRK